MATRKRKNVPTLDTPADIDPYKFNVSADNVNADQVDYTDTTFDFNKLSADRLADRFMTAADYTMIDPADVQGEFGDINRSEMTKNAALSSQLALNALDTELTGLQNYAPTAANLQRQEIAKDNTFNTEERLRALDSADPGIRTDLASQADRARAYAEGRVPDSILDRQLELGIQSSAADRAATGGFGAGSSAAMKAGQLMSAEQRIGLSQYGDQLLTSNVGNRTNLLAPTEYANAGSQISAAPSFSAGQASMAIASQANQGNITAKDALSSKAQQSQFKAGLEQDTNKTNLLTQSEKDLNQAKLDLQADSTNADNDIRTQLAGKQISSAEKQFNAQLSTNTAISNADRAFSAANANAGRALEVTTTNRAVALEVDKTNKTMVFQDMQRIATQKFQDQQARAANAAANARAAMSAGAQAAALEAQKAESAADREFQLSQQQMAYDIYQQNRGDAQSSASWANAGNMIARAPAIISAGSSIINGISGWFGGSDIETAASGWDKVSGLFGG